MLREDAQSGVMGWELLFSPRKEIWNNRLHAFRDYDDTNASGDIPNSIMGDVGAKACIKGWLDFKDKMSHD